MASNTTELPDIILYDIPTNDSPPRSWSVNAFKAHYALNYKGLPYKTCWVEFPDLEPTFKSLGIKPNASGYAYSIPTIRVTQVGDDTSAQYFSPSDVIVDWLDKTFPSRQLWRGSAESQAVQKEFINVRLPKIYAKGLIDIMWSTVVNLFNPVSAEYYRRTREARYGGKLEELHLGPEDSWAGIASSLDEIGEWIDGQEKEGKEVLVAPDEDGKMEPTYAGLVLASALRWVERAGPEGAADRIKALNGGRWGKAWDLAEPYTKESPHRFVFGESGIHN